ncbi:MAG: efflux RND transporter periplasmic adaptor subunit [Deltaproteobacteria bacterium]
MRKLLVLAIIGIAVLACGLYYFHGRYRHSPISFRTARVERGPIATMVSSTGTVNPVVTVKVGAEVTGKIKELYADFNSEVTENQLIARIDPEPFEARVNQAKADLKIALADVEIRKAAVERARADLENAKSGLTASAAQSEKARVAAADAKRDLRRKKALHQSHAIAVRQFEQAEAAHDQAVAQLHSVEAQREAQISAIRSRDAALKMEQAQLAHAKAQVEHYKAALHDVTIELDHTAIRSPVNGVVISREMDIGQTVVSRLQAPTLFTIAQDLRKMQVETSVDEADIGRICVGQAATFTVDAFPGKKFSGVVDQVRKAPNTIHNVVTYTVVLSTNNSDLTLLPGMTATVHVLVKKFDNALKVPNAALRFRPPTAGSVSGKASAAGRGAMSARERLERLIKALNMTEAQQAKIWSLYDEVKQRVIAQIAMGASSSDKQAAIQAARQRMQKAIEAMLTPSQKEKQRYLLAQRRIAERKPGRVWVKGEDGKPQAVDIIIGISDGSSTQVVSGDLKEGREVIVGIRKGRAPKNGPGSKK